MESKLFWMMAAILLLIFSVAAAEIYPDHLLSMALPAIAIGFSILLLKTLKTKP